MDMSAVLFSRADLRHETPPPHTHTPCCLPACVVCVVCVPCVPPRYSWLDPEAIPVMVKLQLFNMETGQLEASFPQGFWTFVAQVCD